MASRAKGVAEMPLLCGSCCECVKVKIFYIYTEKKYLSLLGMGICYHQDYPAHVGADAIPFRC